MTQAYINRADLKTRLNIGGTAQDALLDDFVAYTNEWIEHETWRPIGPDTGGTATFDGYNSVSSDGTTLYVNQGIRTITSITVAPSTGATPVAGTVADFVILPRTQDRRPGEPGFEVRVKDVVTGSVTRFYHGFGDIVVVGDFGWAAIPSELSELGYRVAARSWHARNAGQQDIVGADEVGNPIVSRFVSSMDWKLIKSFRPAGGLVVG